MKVYLHSDGDMSVGIWPCHATIDTPSDPLDNEADRKAFREIMVDAFSQWWDMGCDLVFEDECPDCGERKTAHKAGCPSGDAI